MLVSKSKTYRKTDKKKEEKTIEKKDENSMVLPSQLLQKHVRAHASAETKRPFHQWTDVTR